MSARRRLGIGARRVAALLLAVVAILAIVACARPRAATEPVVILVSFDGWRWDYLDEIAAPHLKALAARGVRATELIPVFPSLTFPNHYTLVTGLYPAHHGIVSNDMMDPAIPERFSMSAATAKDPRWWRGEPIWVTAIRQGRRAASMFWPGAEVEIGGIRPTYWQPFDDKFPNALRIDKVLGWMQLPDAQRPSFISVYFSDTDHAGHDYGPLSPQLVEAATRVDNALGDLVEGLERLGAMDHTTVVVVSDHGMTPVTDDRLIYLEDYIDLNTIDAVQWNELVQILPAAGVPLDAIYARLSGRVPHTTFYRKADVPARLHFSGSDRIPPLIGIPDAGWLVTSRARERKRREEGKPPHRGAHGYDPDVRDMHGLFVAAGPTLRRGYVVPRLESVDVYDVLCALLKLTPAPNDGDAAATRALFGR